RGREAQTRELTRQAAFDAGIGERGVRDADARDGAAGADAEAHADVAFEVRIATERDLVTRLEGAHARADDAPNLLRREALSGPGRFLAGDAALAASTLTGPRAAAAPGTATAAPAGPTLALAEPAAHAHAEPGVERARAERDPRVGGSTGARSAAAQAEAHALAEDEVLGAQPAERVGDGADRAQRLLHLVADIARQRFGHAAEGRADIA